MNHSFLLKPARWNVEGSYWQNNAQTSTVTGSIKVSWQRESWFKITTQLSTGEPSLLQIASGCKGYLDLQRKSYTYVLQHNILGNIEGEGRLGSDSIIQHYWIVGSVQRRVGIDTFYRISEDQYHLTKVLLESHNLISTMEATLKHVI